MKIPHRVIEKVAEDFVSKMVKELDIEVDEVEKYFINAFMATAMAAANDKDIPEASPPMIFNLSKPLVQLLRHCDVDEARKEGVWDQDEHPIELLTMICGLTISPYMSVMFASLDDILKDAHTAGGVH